MCVAHVFSKSMKTRFNGSYISRYDITRFDGSYISLRIMSGLNNDLERLVSL